MKFAYLILAVKDGSDAFRESAMPWMIIFGLAATLATVAMWLVGWESIPVVMAMFAIFSAMALGVGLSLLFSGVADIALWLTGHTEVELEARRA